MSENEASLAEIEAILKKDPEVHQAVMNLQKALEDYEQTQAYILGQSQKGLTVPNLEQRAHAVQRNIAVAMDRLAMSGEACEDAQVQHIAIGVQQGAMMYFQSFFTTIHYSRMMMAHPDGKPYERLLHEAYALLERSVQKNRGSVKKLS